MKEKLVISLLCDIVLVFVFFNCDTGVSGRQTAIPTVDNIGEARFVLTQTEDNMYQWSEVTNENSASQSNASLPLYSLSACMIEADTGRILFGKDEIQERAMASTTKILTCLIALENCSLDEIVTVSEYAASMPDVQLNAKAGEQFRLYDLLLSLMLESHNDTAVAIAEHVGGTVDEFCRIMTDRANELGCNHSTFLTPNGLDKERTTENGTEKHATTAYELAVIMRECIKNEQFVSICRTQNAMISNVKHTANYQLTNHNALLNMMEGVIAGKTGFTCDAGYCYVGAVEHNDSVFICALLGCGWPNHKNYKWYDMNVLMDYAKSEFFSVEISNDIIKNKIPSMIPVTDGIKNMVPCHTINIGIENAESERLLMRSGEQIVVTYSVPSAVTAPVYQGEKIGEISYIINGQTIKCESLTALETIEKQTWKHYFMLLLQDYILSVSSVKSSEKCAS